MLRPRTFAQRLRSDLARYATRRPMAPTPPTPAPANLPGQYNKPRPGRVGKRWPSFKVGR